MSRSVWLESEIVTLEQRLAEVAGHYPKNLAVQDLVRVPLTFSMLMNVFEKIRTSTRNAGISSGDRVAIWLESRADMAIWIAALCNSVECIPLSRTLSNGQAEDILKSLNPTALIVSDHNKPIGGVEILAQALPVFSVQREMEHDWSWLISGSISSPAASWTVMGENEIAVILLTSGSTAAPKFVPVTHKAIISTVMRSAQLLELKPGEKNINIMSLNHVHGLISGVFLPWISAGCCIMPGEFSAQLFLTWYKRAQPNWFSTSPAIYADILRRARTAGVNLKLSSLRFVRCGSASLTPTLAREIGDSFGVPLLEAYGMSEALQITGIPFSQQRLGSVGLPIVNLVQTFDPKGVECLSDCTGEIRVKGPSVMKHYLGGTDPSQGFVDGWFSTGDIGYFDSDGFLFVTGRIKDMINLGGENISPCEIETVLHQHPNIEECFVFSQYHPTLGESLSAAVVFQNRGGADLAEVRSYATKILPRFKVPSKIYVLDHFPRDANGKMDRKKILEHTQNQIKHNEDKILSGFIEKWLGDHVSSVLRDIPVFANSDFFDLGGDSLDSAELLMRLEQQLNVTIHMPLFLNSSTIRDFAQALQTTYPEEINKIKSGKKINIMPNGNRVVSSSMQADFKATLPSLGKIEQSQLSHPSISPVFILSAPRCGSTLLRVMLAGHPEIFAPPELRLLGYRTLDQWAAAHDGKFSFFREGLVQALMEALQIEQDVALRWINDAIDDRLPVEAVYRKLQDAIGSSRLLVDKTPLYALDANTLESILTRFKQPRFIVLRRNPHEMKRSYVNAHMDQLWMYPNTTDSNQLAELIWFQCYSNIEHFTASLNPKSVINLHFEDLVQEPLESASKICQFLRLQLHPEVLNPYGNRQKRMTESIKSSSAMIGDPSFFQHRKINSSRAGINFELFGNNNLAEQTLNLAEKIGYFRNTNNEQVLATKISSEPILIQRQRRLVKNWKNERKEAENMIFGMNTKGTAIPIFWCTQGENEYLMLSEGLGSNQPVYGMRSGHLLISKFDAGVNVLARVYIKQLIRIYPEGRFILGGNCQGAYLAREMARELIKIGRHIELIFFIEADFYAPLDIPVANVYGKDSHFNPYIKEENPGHRWVDMYPRYSVDFIPCKHGEIFTNKNIPKLIKIIRSRKKRIQIILFFFQSIDMTKAALIKIYRKVLL